MAGLVIAWQSNPRLHTILAQLVAQVTTIGESDVWIVVDDPERQPFRVNLSQAAGAQTNRLHFLVREVDSPWARDFGPRYIFEGDCRAVVRFTYDWGEVNEDAFSGTFAAFLQQALYELPLRHNGGNFLVSALGDAHVTRLLALVNPDLSEDKIRQFLSDYLNVQVTFYPLTHAELSGHVDMWMMICGDRRVMINDWPFNAGSVADQVCDAAAEAMAARGYAVHRLPALTNALSGTYTYANAVICNQLVLVPAFSAPQACPFNTAALDAWQEAMPEATVVPVDCEAVVEMGGFLHCLAAPIPRARGGVNPTVYLRTCRGSEILRPGEAVNIRWISDDDVGVSHVDLWLSTDGGTSFGTQIASGLPALGSFSWVVPDLNVTQGRIRVVAEDAQGHTGSDESQSDLAIQPRRDQDQDGLDDDWEVLSFGDTAVASGTPESDWDRDGFCDLAEFLAGTSPTNAGEYLNLDGISPYEDDGLLITWKTLANRVYTLCATKDLSAIPTWLPIYETRGNGRTRYYIRSGLVAPSFYRLQARPP